MSKSGLLARQKAERELWTIKVIAYTEQQTLDAVCLALAEGFGFGEERLKRFHDAFNAKYTEIRELEKGDTKDNEYAIAKQEAALKAACGKYYARRCFADCANGIMASLPRLQAGKVAAIYSCVHLHTSRHNQGMAQLEAHEKSAGNDLSQHTDTRQVRQRV